MTTKTLFNSGWYFSKTAYQSDYSCHNAPDLSTFKPVDIPHDYLIYNTENLYETSTGWYRKMISINQISLTDSYILRFDGVYMDSVLFVNGEKAGINRYGYNTFEHDITRFLKEGENEILMMVNYQSPNSRWYSGAGIYRNCYLIKHGPVYFKTDGIYISTNSRDNECFDVVIDNEIVCSEDNVYILYEIFDNKEMKGSCITGGTAPANGTFKCSINSPHLWDTNSPFLYYLRAKIMSGNDVLDEHSPLHFGFRNFLMAPDKGLYVNGKHTKLYGVCEHHDLGCLGSAFNKSALKRRFDILKEMGVNAIRTAHNMPSPEFLDLADEMGFLVIAEAFDMWEMKKTEYDYARFFKECAASDLENYIRRDRNRPCILMWSIGNEITDTHISDRGTIITKMLKDVVDKTDYRKNAPATIGSNYMPWENARKCADIVKYAGYNYADKYYEEHHKEHPDWIIYGSETASVVQSRGVYHFPLSESILSDDDLQCSSLGNSTTSWGAPSAEYCIKAEKDCTFSLGQFIWSGFDYIGEPTPYATKNSYFGQIDTAGFKKDAFYMYQSCQTDFNESPMIHVLPYWDFSEGQLIDVRIFTNAPFAELIVNDVSMGKKSIDRNLTFSADYIVPYKEGYIKAVAYDYNGNEIASEMKHSFSEPESLVISADKNTINADGTDLCHITISSIDKNGYPVENACNFVTVVVEGNGRLLGMDNGDSTDFSQYKTNVKQMFNGKLLAIIAPEEVPGEIKITAYAKGLKPASVTIDSSGTCPKTGISCLEKIETPDIISENIPIRKISLHPEGNCGKIFKNNGNTLVIKAKIHPENATIKDLHWKITDQKGINSYIAAYKIIDDNTIEITGKGDGQIRIRAYASCFRDNTTVMGELEYELVDFGNASLNPYEFVSAGLFSDGINISNGNEHGIATHRVLESCVSFSCVDFGEQGSDTITLPVFELDNKPVTIRLYDGDYLKGDAVLIGELEYDKPSKWNVYQSETYTLKKRLYGVRTLSFVLERKIHLKGFSFQKQNRAYCSLNICDYTTIYGDSYTLLEDAVENIGNNVSIVFKNMIFDKGVSKIHINGYCNNVANNIQIMFDNGTDTIREGFEFSPSVDSDYTTQTFNFNKLHGTYDVTFVFLPGSDFNFRGFTFEE